MVVADSRVLYAGSTRVNPASQPPDTGTKKNPTNSSSWWGSSLLAGYFTPAFFFAAFNAAL